MPLVVTSQPMWAWKKPARPPNSPSRPPWGEWGSPSRSDSAWCLRWSVTHWVTGPCTVMEPRIARAARMVGVVANALCEKSR